MVFYSRIYVIFENEPRHAETQHQVPTRNTFFSIIIEIVTLLTTYYLSNVGEEDLSQWHQTVSHIPQRCSKIFLTFLSTKGFSLKRSPQKSRFQAPSIDNLPVAFQISSVTRMFFKYQVPSAEHH